MFRVTENVSPPDALPLAAVAFFASFFIMLLLTPHFLVRLDPPTGDEPFYLMTARSLLYNHRLDETAVWRNKEYLTFYPPEPRPATFEGWPGYPDPLPPHQSKTLRPGLYSKHGVGVAALIMPSYWLDGRTGAVFFINLLGALTAANIFLLAYESTGKRWAGLFAWTAVALSNPLLSYSFLIFPDIIGALFTVYAFRRCRVEKNGLWHTFTLGLSVAALPWLVVRFLPVCFGLIAFYVVKQIWGKLPGFPAQHLLFVGPVVLSGLGLMSFYYYLYGTVMPNLQDHAGSSDLAGTLSGLVGLQLDQQWGVLIHAPIYAIAIVGAVVMWRKRWTDLAWLAVIILPYYVLVANYRQWWGEWCPAGRYLVVVLPLLALPIGWAIVEIKSRLFRWVCALAALAGLGVMIAFLRDPQLMFNQPTGQSNLLVAAGDRIGMNLTGLFSSFVVGKPGLFWLPIVVLSLMVIIGLVMWTQQPYREY